MPELPETLLFFFSVAGGRGDPYNVWLVLVLASLSLAATRFAMSLRLPALILVQLVFAGYMMLSAFWTPNLSRLSLEFGSLSAAMPWISWIVVLWNAAFALYTAFIAATQKTPFHGTHILVFGGHAALFLLIATSFIMDAKQFALPGLLPVAIYSWCVTNVLVAIYNTGRIDGVQDA